MIYTVIRFFEQYLNGRDDLDAYKVQDNPDRSDSRPKWEKADKNQRANTSSRV
jgi:hypothetical protein